MCSALLMETLQEKLCKPEDCVTMDIGKSLLLFDGNRGHSVCNFKGERFSLVYFCTGMYHKANKTVRDELEVFFLFIPQDVFKDLDTQPCQHLSPWGPLRIHLQRKVAQLEN